MKEIALQNTRLDGRYDVLRLLGRGSYAEIFLAQDNLAAPNAANRLVVIKALNVFLQEAPDADLERTLVENFQNEALALDKVRHPNVINRLGHGTARDLRGTVFHYLVLEYLPGGNLSELCRHEPLNFEQTLFYLEQVCSGLQHAHDQGVIHRDIKPQNLLLTENRETVKIADFGVARFAEHDSPITRVGTNVYAAPEHSPANLDSPNFARVEKLTPAADVYSLAKTVYSVMFCESPRRFANAPISDLPEKFKNKPWADGVLKILQRATQTNPSDRFQSVLKFWDEFVELRSELNSAVKPTTSLNTSDLKNLVPAAPVTPSFPSLKAVQQAVAENTGDSFLAKPKIVVELPDKTVPNRQPQTEYQNRPSFLPPEPQNPSGGFVPVYNGNQNVPAQNGHTAQLQEISEPSARVRNYRPAGFLKKLFVGILLLTIFSGVLYGTFQYLNNRGIVPGGIGIFGLSRGVVNKDAWVRSSPSGGNNQIGIASTNSELKIYGRSSDGNWYDVEVVRQGQPGKDNLVNSGTRGWVGKSVIDLK